ncbi:MAG: M56 family metallopeptidase [Bacteroidales bacterium]|nr:M56 family metallopeptidase [Bacteroidales bacterium]
MNPLFLYLLKASISLAIFYGSYTLIYKRVAFFNFNRVFLLFALMTAMILPFFNFNIFGFAGSGGQSPEDMLYYTQLPVFQLNEVAANVDSSVGHSFSFISLLAYIYFVVVLIRLVRFFVRLQQISNISNSNKNTYKDGVRFVLTKNDLPVFSFFNRVFIDEEMFAKQDAAKIIQHEKVHITQFHSVDLILAEMVCIFQWFNPFAYLLKKAVKENHEFIADQKMVLHQADANAYRLLLMEYATPIKTNILTHNFSYSLLKRRLHMMKKRKSIRRFAFNLFWMLPVLLLVLFACSSPKTDSGIISDNTVMNANPTNANSDSISVRTILGEGGELTFVVYTGETRNIKMDIFSKDGKYRKRLYNDEMPGGLNAILLKQSEDKFMKNGEYVYQLQTDDDLIIKGSFTLKSPNVEEGGIFDSNDDVFVVVEKQPEFPGGMDSLFAYLAKSVKYPEQAKKDSIAGRVFVGFIIEKDGSIGAVKLLRGIGGGCDEEAMRAVAEMPKWTPGEQRGQVVRVRFNLPIKFTLG